MTLILNEIHILNGLSETFQIAAADRRITRGSKIEKPRRKLFPIPHLNSTVSYFGLASFLKSGKEIYFSEWFPSFISKSYHTKTLEEFSNHLRDTLNVEISLSQRRKFHSGFHLCGYRADGLPEFWHFSNISGMEGPYYKDPVELYGKPTSDFLQRDAIKLFHWDETNPNSATNGTQIYRNGDIRTHAITSEILDAAMNEIMKLPDFNRPSNIEEYADYVKFKFEFISYIYKNWAQKKIISRPIDIIILTENGIKEKKNNKWQLVSAPIRK
jgi:hypothetical protein